MILINLLRFYNLYCYKLLLQNIYYKHTRKRVQFFEDLQKLKCLLVLNQEHIHIHLYPK